MIVKKNNIQFPKCYAARSNNDDVIYNSSSGGIFTEIAVWVLSKDGVVFGAMINQDNKVVHSCVKDLKDLDSLKGSKYVQSSLGDTFKKIKEVLNSDKYVLFCGTPCQVAGLKKYVGKATDKLILLDIVCHGVPSPKLLEKYIEYQEKRYSAGVTELNFREKKYGWENYSMFLKFENKKQYRKVGYNDPYMRMFLSNAFLRPACYECQFKKILKSGDITLADFWGIKNIYPQFNDNKGVSLVLINNEKGEKIVREIYQKIKLVEVDLEKSINGNPSIIMSSKMSEKRQVAFENIDELSFKKLYYKTCVPLWREKFRRIKYKLKKEI